LVTTEKGCNAAVVADMTLFRPRKQGNGKAQKTFRGNISKKLDFVHL